jgi:DNA-binding NarL/FixJ family response regulator
MSLTTLDMASIEDPRDGLRAVVALRVLADRLETREVDRALAAGWTYQEIAEALGVSRQAVHKKHGKRR